MKDLYKFGVFLHNNKFWDALIEQIHVLPDRNIEPVSYTHLLKAHLYPFAAVKEDGAIAYVEDHEVKITEPIAFNMEQEEMALTGQHRCV